MRVFLSYRRADAEAEARSIEQRLRQMPDIKHVFLDHETIPKGRDFVEAIHQAIRKSGVVLVLIGDRWRGIDPETGRARLDEETDFVRLEVAEALRSGKHVIPVLLNDTWMPGPDVLPEDLQPLSRLNAARIRMEDFEEDVDDLLDVMFGARRRVSRWTVPRLTVFRAIRLFVYGAVAALLFLILFGILNQTLSGGGTMHTLLQDMFGRSADTAYLILLGHIVFDVFIIGAITPFLYRLAKQSRKR